MLNPLEDVLLIGRNPDSMSKFLVLYICTDCPQYLLVHLMDGLLQLLVDLSVQPPTKIECFFCPCRTFNGSIVDGLGELLRVKFLSYQTMMTSLENRHEDYKKTTPKPNQLLSLLVKAMHDACHRLESLKTAYSEMRFGVTEFP
jgi:hypothetical protein